MKHPKCDGYRIWGRSFPCGTVVSITRFLTFLAQTQIVRWTFQSIMPYTGRLMLFKKKKTGTKEL